MIDFGTAFNIHENNGNAEKIGTLSYMSPEVLLAKRKIVDHGALDEDMKPVNENNGKYLQCQQIFGMKSDMWAIGVIAYILICQKMPFNFGADNPKMNNKAMETFKDQFKNFVNYEDYEEYRQMVKEKKENGEQVEEHE